MVILHSVSLYFDTDHERTRVKLMTSLFTWKWHQ